MTFLAWLYDTFERALVSAGIAMLALITADGLSDFSADYGKKLGVAGFVAVAVTLKNAALPTAGLGLTPVLDVVARAGWSAVQAGAAVATAAAGFDWFSATAWQTAGVAALTAAGSVIKGYLATRLVPSTLTPASLAPAPSPSRPL